MAEIIRWVADPANYPLDTRWEDLPVELRVPQAGVCVEATAESLERMMAIERSDGAPYFSSAFDALISRLIAFTPHAECWIKDVRIVEHDDTYKHPKGAWAQWIAEHGDVLSCSDDEPEPEDPSCQEPAGPAEPPAFWSEEDWKENLQELAEIEQESAQAEWDARHPEARCPPRE